MASFKKLTTGWQYRISYKDSDGKYKQKSRNGFKTKAEAKIHADKEEALLERQIINNSTKDRNLTFIDYFIQWYEIYKKPHISEITQQTYSVLINTIKRHFGSLLLSSLSTEYYQNFLNELGKTNAKSTVNKRHKQIKSCLDHALHTGALATDVTYNARISGAPGKKESHKYLDQKDAKLLMDTLLDGYDGSQTGKAMVMFALSTGCRLGEVMALTEDCIDRKKMMITIKKSWDYKINHTFTETKTASSVRKIAIDSSTLSIIEKHMKYYKELALKNGIRNRNKLVFVGRDLCPISSTGANKALRSACVKSGIKVITFHSLRHTHASLLLLGGSDIFFVSKRLGHKTSTITADVYAHVLQEMEDKGNEQVNSLANKLFS